MQVRVCVASDVFNLLYFSIHVVVIDAAVCYLVSQSISKLMVDSTHIFHPSLSYMICSSHSQTLFYSFAYFQYVDEFGFDLINLSIVLAFLREVDHASFLFGFQESFLELQLRLRHHL